jgi:hypothetical protein
VVGVLHVVPLGDAVEHTSDDDCVCGPTAKPIKAEDGSINWIMIHHSLDGREIDESDRQP